MRLFCKQVFRDFVMGTGTVYTSDVYSDLLGAADQIAIQAVADAVSGTTPSLIVSVQHSADGRIWVDKAATPAIDNRSISSSSTNVEFGTDTGSTPSLGKVRLRIALGGTGPAAHIKIYVCARGTRRGVFIAEGNRADRPKDDLTRSFPQVFADRHRRQHGVAALTAGPGDSAPCGDCLLKAFRDCDKLWETWATASPCVTKPSSTYYDDDQLSCVNNAEKIAKACALRFKMCRCPSPTSYDLCESCQDASESECLKGCGLGSPQCYAACGVKAWSQCRKVCPSA